MKDEIDENMQRWKEGRPFTHAEKVQPPGLSLTLGEIAELVSILAETETYDAHKLHEKFRQAMVAVAHGNIEALGIMVIGNLHPTEQSRADRFKELLLAERKLKQIQEILQ